ncbi:MULTISPECIES: hypothetical protein [unclassified Massilia]|uniref:hypothetical protein n=1 Tax=unclassified Massilia TaxID=2609279 RepID=UPI001782CA14|nr:MULTISPECIES: hypothetical protein [unclassified Massilia]MBD8531523.1 hypothetical protein [Massilia sp. CFBP 13647]MBD8673681.1 hypothetical protein [Massilia sp. CFBP 13721]
MNSINNYRKLKAFGNQVKTEADRDLVESVRDLTVLRHIETTLDALDVRCLQLRQVNLAADHFIELASQAELPPSSSDVDVVALFENARDAVGDAYDRWSVKHLCAVNAPELTEEDGIVDGYALLLTEVASLHDKLNTLSWIIREQEADQDKMMPGEFTDADDLFAAMGV